MKKYTFTEEELKELLLYSFRQGEAYTENWSLEQQGEIEEITELDFEEWYEILNLKENEL